MAYKRVSKKLTVAVIAEAEALIEAERHKPATEWREPKTGFAICFYPNSGSYLLRTRATTITLGTVGTLTAQAARHLAQEAKSAIKDGRDAKAYVKTFTERLRAGDDTNAAHARATAESARTGGVIPGAAVWLVDDLIKKFVEHKLEEFKEGRWRRQFERLFEDPVWNRIRRMRVCDVDHAEFFNFKRAAAPDKKVTARAARLVSMLVALFDFGLNEHAPECGLLGRDPIWRALSLPYRAKKRRRAPEVAELARMVLAVDQHASLGDDAVRTSATLRALLYFIVATAQRTGAACTLRRADILAHPSQDEWRVGHFSAEVMKGRKGEGLAHAVPLPPSVCARLEELWASVDPNGESDYAFPASRGKGHIAATGLNQLLAQLRGDAKDGRRPPKTDYQGKPGPKPRPIRTGPGPDLFERYLRELKDPESETRFVWHDVRRSLTNQLAERGLGGAASAILAHVQEVRQDVRSEESLAEQMERTTSRHYFTAQRLTLKTMGLLEWNRALEAALVSERDRVIEIARHAS